MDAMTMHQATTTQTPTAELWTFSRLQTYVGRPYLEGEFDCADLAALVQAEVFGRAVALPAARRRPQGRAGQCATIHALRDAVALRVDMPFTGCGVLLTEPAQGGLAWHIGTGAMHRGEVWVLHNSNPATGARLERLQDLQRWGLRLEGFYAWK